MITAESLLKAGWQKAGNAWYKNTKCITNNGGEWQLWTNGVNRTVKIMEDL